MQTRAETSSLDYAEGSRDCRTRKITCDGELSVYVDTYGKYNDGSICGLWVNLSSIFGKPKRQADDGRELFMFDYSMGANNHGFRRI